jgi:glycosyltransferase involved in cell wall biosynthesis
MKKRILILSEIFYPAYKGGGVVQSMTNMVRNLGADFDFWVISLNHEHRSPEQLLEVESDRWIDFEGKAQVYYASWMSLGLLKSLFDQVKPQAVYVNGFHEPYFVAIPIWMARSRGLQVIQAPRGLLQAGAMQSKTLKKQLFLKVFKLAGLHRHTRWHATDKQEVQDIQQHFGHKAQVVQADDMPDFREIPWEVADKTPRQLRLVTVSLITPKKNHLYTLQQLSRLNLPVEYDIYGPVYDQAYWKKCEECISKLPAHVQVKWKGPIPPSALYDTLKPYHFFVLPTLGENFGHAIYEALKAGKPVLVSDKTPWQGLQSQQAGWVFSLDDPENMANALRQAWNMEGTEYQQWSEGARQVVQHFIEHSGYLLQYHTLFA